MAKSSKNWVRLAASPQMADATDGAFQAIDLSAYVDPLRSRAFRITTAKVILMTDDVPYGLANSSTTATVPVSFGMQIATGTQTTILRPSDGKVIYHNFAQYIHDVDATTGWTFVEWNVTDLWPDGYVAVVDSLTASVDGTTDLSASFRVSFTLAGYQEKVSANQLASLLIAQTQ